MLELSHVSYTFKSKPSSLLSQPFFGIHDLSLCLHTGEIVALLGANASGKSTLAQLIALHLVPESGEILIDGVLVDHSAKASVLRSLRKQLGFLRQDPDTQILMSTVYEDIAFGPCNLGLSEIEVRRRVEELLELLDLKQLAHTSPAKLSGGQKQRVALAGILAMRPRYLILDEPCSMLDSAASSSFLALCKELVSQEEYPLGILLISHNLADLSICTRMYSLCDGALDFSGSCEAFLEDAAAVERLGCSYTPLQSMLKQLPYEDGLSEFHRLPVRSLVQRLLR